MRVTARQATRSVAEGELHHQTGAPVPADGIRIEFPKPTPADRGAGRLHARLRRGERHALGLQVHHDLAPARGMLTAVGLGMALWGVGFLLVRLATA